MAPQAEGDLVAVRTHVLRQSVSQSVRQLVITIFYLPLVLLTVRNDPPAVLQVCVDRTPLGSASLVHTSADLPLPPSCILHLQPGRPR